MTPFRERNPIPIAVIGIIVLLALLFAAFNAGSLPIIGGGRTLAADFADASGLKAQDDVRIAGIKVGKVESVQLHGAVVRVTFSDSSGTRLGSQARASIKIKTLLGQKYVDLIPAGPGELKGPIPVSRTDTPLIVTEAFIGLGQRAGKIDTDLLAKSFDVLANTFKGSAPYAEQSLRGLAKVSQSIASRNEELSRLLEHARGVTGVLAKRDAQVGRLVEDGNLVLQTISQQRAVIHELLVNTTKLSQQLTGLVKENKAVLGPALDNLHAVLVILQKHQDDIDTAVHELAPFVRLFDNTLGNGHFFDNFIPNLPPAKATVGSSGGTG